MAQQQDFDKSLLKYTAVYPQAPMDMKYHYYDGDVLKIRPETSRLIRSVEELREYAESCKGLKVAVDTETTGLSYHKDFIVGFSIAKDMYHGIYVPIRHQIKRVEEVEEIVLDKDGNPVTTKSGKTKTKKKKIETFFENPANLPAKECLDILFDIMKNANLVLMHNSEFDLTMIGQEGYDVMSCKTFDTTILTYIYDSENKSWNKLKEASKIVLGRHPMKFAEALGTEDNFRYVDLDVAYPYASADACHDEQTEVLTKKGWVFWKDYDGITPLASPNLVTNTLEWATPTKVIKYNYNGLMKYYKARNQDWMVTPNHNMLVHASQKTQREVLYKQADSLNESEVIYTGPTEKISSKKYYTIGEHVISEVDLARLTGLILSDGWVNNITKTQRTHTVGVCVSENKRFSYIDSFLKSLPFKATYYKPNPDRVIWKWESYSKDLWNVFIDCCHEGSTGKFVPQFIKDMSAEAIYEFLKYYSYADGSCTNWDSFHNNKRNWCIEICTTSTKMKDDIQELLTTIGFRSKATQRPPKDSMIAGRLIKKENCAPQWLIYFNGAKTYIRGEFIQDVPYNGTVYCATVPNHTLVTRRNGCVLVSGNCNTYGLFTKLYPAVKQLLSKAPKIMTFKGEKHPYNVVARDNELIRAFTDYYNKVDLLVNRQTAKDYQKYVEDTLVETETEIYKFFNKGVFNLSTGSKEFKDTMKEFHIVTGAFTEKGAPSYGKEGVAEMGRTLDNIKDVLTRFRTFDYNEKSGAINKRHSKDELKMTGWMLTYGKEQFKMVETANTLNVRTIEGIKCTKRELFDELKLMYKTIQKNMNILQLIQKRSSLMKALNSYIAKLTEVDKCHMRYRLQGTASGRLSSGNGSKSDKRKNHYFIDLNAQNLTKPHSAYYKAVKSDEEGNILGWKFELVSEEYYHEHKEDEIIVEGSDPKNNIRNCLVAPEGRYILSMDYSAQEYLVLAILSGDMHMVNNFKNGVDPHTATAYMVWGEENYDRQKRKKAKSCNFLMNYSGGPTTLAKNLNIPLEEAEHIIDMYKKGFWQCIQWKEKCIRDCIDRQGGVAYTPFGRPRQFSSRLRTSADISALGQQGSYKGISSASLMSKANGLMKAVERRIVSHEIQSTCGDICRWDLIRLYRKYFKHRDPDIDFMTTVHDEINYTVTKEKVIQYAREIDDIMTITDFREDLPIKTSIDLGYTLGVLFPFEWEDETRTNLVPSRA